MKKCRLTITEDELKQLRLAAELLYRDSVGAEDGGQAWRCYCAVAEMAQRAEPVEAEDAA